MTLIGRLVATLALAIGASPLHAALLPAAAPTELAAEVPEAGSIDQQPEDGTDRRIAERLKDIFANVPSLAAVEVDVREGVVKLSGTVRDDAAIPRARAIAMGVDGVVTVESAVERDVSVDIGEGVGGLEDRARDIWEMLPLLGLALLVGGLVAGTGYLLTAFRSLWDRITPNGFLAELLIGAVRFVFLVLGVVIALDMIGAAALMGAVLGGAGVIGIALGFAMRDTVENYMASLMLSLRQPFRANDHVVIENHEGRVIRLTSRATVLMTLDGNHLRIPNSTVFKGVILNYTRNPQRRFDFVLGIDADDDAEAARQLGRETLLELTFVLADPAPEVRILKIGNSNIVLQFLAWIDQRQADWEKARSRAISSCKTALENAGFALPEPIYRLRFDQRTVPLPLENRGERLEPAPRPSPTSASTPSSQDEDFAPEDEIVRMVESEREDDAEQAQDLLDNNRPVE